MARIYDGTSNALATAVGTVTDPGLGGTLVVDSAQRDDGSCYIRVGLENGKKNADGKLLCDPGRSPGVVRHKNLLTPGSSTAPITNNLASFKPSYMVRLTPDILPASNANDDDYSTETKTTTATVDGYWEVDLGATFALYGVRTIGASGIGSRLTYATARFYDEGHNSVYAKRLSGTPDVFDTDVGGPLLAPLRAHRSRRQAADRPGRRARMVHRNAGGRGVREADQRSVVHPRILDVGAAGQRRPTGDALVESGGGSSRGDSSGAGFRGAGRTDPSGAGQITVTPTLNPPSFSSSPRMRRKFLRARWASKSVPSPCRCALVKSLPTTSTHWRTDMVMRPTGSSCATRVTRPSTWAATA